MSADLPCRPSLDAAELSTALPGWRAVEVVETSPSTNADLAARARAGEPPGLLLVAEHQTAGRGRLDRSWVVPPRAALTLSALLAPREVPASRWPWLPLLAGLAVLAGVRRATGVAATLKWPNDVLVGESKLAGILVELVEAPQGPVAVVGIGLNVSTSRAELPTAEATSLVLEGVPDPDRGALLVAVAEELGERYAWWQAGAGEVAKLSEAYAESCSTLGREVRVRLPDGGEIVGTASGVEPDGRLRVDTAAGSTVLGAGDVIHLRDA